MTTIHFELGKNYIVNVTKKGIIPLIEFNDSEWYNKDQDDLDFLTDEEKILVIHDVLDKIRSEIEALPKTYPFVNHFDMYVKEDDVDKIINKYMA